MIKAASMFAISAIAGAAVLYNVALKPLDEDVQHVVQVQGSHRSTVGKQPLTANELISDTELISSADINEISFNEPFADPNDETAKSLAKDKGISVSDAHEQLVLMVAAGHLGEELKRKYPKKFRSMSVTHDGALKFEAHFSGGDTQSLKRDVKDLAKSVSQKMAKVERVPKSLIQNYIV